MLERVLLQELVAQCRFVNYHLTEICRFFSHTETLTYVDQLNGCLFLQHLDTLGMVF